MSDVLVAFEKLPIGLKLNEIHRKLELLMSREQELEALVAQNGAAIASLTTEVGELKTAGDAALARQGETIAAQTAAITALTAEVQAARQGAVSPEKMAELQAASDAAVANAAAAKAIADEAEAAWNAIGQPPA